jgi:hypothetical protein
VAATSRGVRFVIFHTADELDVLFRRRVARGPAVLVLRIPCVAAKQLRRWERTLNARFNACGCTLGATSTLLALLGTVIWQSWYSGWSLTHWSAFALRAIACSILGGALGKTLGKQIAHWDLRRVARNIQRRVRSIEAGDPGCQVAQSG